MPVMTHRRPRAGAETLDVSIVLPCLDEEGSVGRCVQEVFAACSEAALRVEVVVVDNNCTDASADVARRAGARVVAEPTPGYGAAIRAGITAARGTVVVMADADCTYPLDRVAELVRPVLAGQADIMVGSRLDAATHRSMPFLHRFVGTPTLSFLVREGVGAVQLTDSQSGYRAFRRDTIVGLELTSTGMEFASEMLIRATQHELRVLEIPLGYRERVGESKLNTWADGMRHLRLILRLSPHLLLWHPGLALAATALAMFGLSLLDPAGVNIGSVTWQPIFLSSTLLVLGIAATLTAAVLGHHLPTASPTVRRTFAWVAERSFILWTRRVGLGLALGGIGLDLALLVLWRRHVALPLYERLALAGLAQALLLTGTLLTAFAVLYNLLARPASTLNANRRRPS